jgi:hypothetical protein
MKIEKSIAYQVLANGDIGGEVAIHSVACVCIITTLTRLRTVGIWCEANLTLQRRDQHKTHALGIEESCGLQCKT